MNLFLQVKTIVSIQKLQIGGKIFFSDFLRTSRCKYVETIDDI